jgi:hypothetical protein
MIAAAFTLMAGHMAAPDVSDFFPLHPGDVYTFHESGAGLQDDFVDTVGEPMDIAGAQAFPISTKTDQESGSETTYYRIFENKVIIVAFDPKAPLKEPYSIIQLNDRGQKWNYIGATTLMGVEAALKMEGRSKMIGQREVLGSKVDVLEVVLDATVVDTQASEHMNQPVGLKTKQTALYARGIGLYEMKEEAQLGKQKSTRIRTLTKYKKAGEAGG